MTSGRPDGGWGWVVALAGCLTSIIIDGVKYSFGILFLELLSTFRGTKGETSMIMSIQLGSILLSGPIAGALVNRFGCMRVAAVGSLIASVAFLVSMFATSLIWLYITFGLFGGFGFCLMSLPPFVTIARYFDKHLALATGICAMGSGLGTLIFNPVSKILIDHYTWRGTMLIQASFILNGLMVAIVLRRPTIRNVCSDVTIEKQSDCNVENTKAVSNRDNKDTLKIQFKCVEYNADSEGKGFTESTLGYNMSISETNISAIHDGVDNIDSNRSFSQMNLEGYTVENETLLENRQTYHGSIGIEKNNGSPKSRKKRWLSLEPLKNPGFLLLTLSSLLSEMAMNTPFAFLPDLMVTNGYEKEQAVWVMFLIGLMSTIARVVVGIIADLPCISRVYLCGALLLTNGVLLVLSPFCFNYASFVAFGALFGLTAGSSNVLRGVLMPELFGVEMIADMMGISYFFSSIAAFAGLPKNGALYDATGSYMPPFVMSGSELALAGLIIIIIPRVLKWWNARFS